MALLTPSEYWTGAIVPSMIALVVLYLQRHFDRQAAIHQEKIRDWEDLFIAVTTLFNQSVSLKGRAGSKPDVEVLSSQLYDLAGRVDMIGIRTRSRRLNSLCNELAEKIWSILEDTPDEGGSGVRNEADGAEPASRAFWLLGGFRDYILVEMGLDMRTSASNGWIGIQHPELGTLNRFKRVWGEGRNASDSWLDRIRRFIQMEKSARQLGRSKNANESDRISQ